MEIGFTSPNFFSQACLDLIVNICVYDPRERLTLEQVLDHPWMNPQEDNVNEREINDLLPESADVHFPVGNQTSLVTKDTSKGGCYCI